MSQCLSGWTQHCLWGPLDQSVCCGGEPLYYDFPMLYNFAPTDTKPHHCCFLGIENASYTCEGTDVGTERADGYYCGYGCTTCDDKALADYLEAIDGRRWLAASRRSGRRTWDARGMIHDLHSNEYWPIPGRIVYERGTCWQNDGLECFGADACACFGANTISPAIDEDGRCNGIMQGHELPGLLPDLFFRTGYRWPPNVPGAPTQGTEQWYCRKFGDTRRSVDEGGHDWTNVVVDPTNSGGLTGYVEPMMDPALLSSNVCQSDRLADCTGMYGTPGTESPCYWHSALGVCIQACIEPTPECEEQCKRTYYSGVHNKFDYLDISGTVETPPYIITDEDDHSQLGNRTAAWKNAILEAIRTQEFPLPREEGATKRTISFDRLEHVAYTDQSNEGIGLYRREWSGEPSPDWPYTWPYHPPAVALGTLVEVHGGQGAGRLRQAGCLFDYRTYINRVKIECRLVLQQVRIGSGGAAQLHIEPLVRFHIVATTTMTVSNLYRQTEEGRSETCGITTSRHELPVYLQVRNEWTPDGYVQRLYTSSTPPLPEGKQWDYGESLMFFDAEDRQFIPSPVVEWRGFLGGHSKPSSMDRRFILPIGVRSCADLAQRFVAIVPGWPTHADSQSADPAGTYGGQVRLEFYDPERLRKVPSPADRAAVRR